MQGLYLNPDAWYDEREITTWLNTRALWIDRAQPRRSRSAPARSCAYDRADPGHRLAQLRARRSRASASPAPASCATAADAMDLRAYAQRVGSRRARRRRRRPARPRGRLRAAQARPEDDRARALRPACSAASSTQRAGELLRHYLEGLGLEILLNAEVERRRRPAAGCAAIDLTRRPPPRRPDPARGRRASSPTSSSPATRGWPINRGVLVDDRMRTERPGHLRRGRRRRVRGPGPRPVADGGRAGRGRGRERRRRRQAVRRRRARHDPQGRRHRARVASAASRRPARTRRRSSSRTPPARYRKLVIADGRIVGAILLGPGNDVAAVRTAITRGFDVSTSSTRCARALGRARAAQRRPAARPRRRRIAEYVPQAGV